MAVPLNVMADSQPGDVDEYGWRAVENCAFDDHTQCVSGHWLPPGGGVGNPASGIGQTAFNALRTIILPRATPGSADGDRTTRDTKRNGSMRADAFYTSWEIDGASKVEGSTFGLNPSIIFGSENVDFGVTVPLHVISPKEGDNIYNAGVDAMLRIYLGENLSIGGHGMYLHEFGEDSDYDKHYYLSGGPFIALMLPINDVFSLSLACMYEYVKPEDDCYGDDVQLLIPAANAGFALSDEMAINVYAMYFKNLDSDVDDDYYIDVGGDLTLQLGSVWSLSVGGKTTMELEDYTSWEGYVGSEWLF
jgi:hypothetical protein